MEMIYKSSKTTKKMEICKKECLVKLILTSLKIVQCIANTLMMGLKELTQLACSAKGLESLSEIELQLGCLKMDFRSTFKTLLARLKHHIRMSIHTDLFSVLLPTEKQVI